MSLLLLKEEQDALQRLHGAENGPPVTNHKTPGDILDIWISLLFTKYFKGMGYRKERTNFRLIQADGLGKIVNFQRNLYNCAESCKFTVNTGIYFEATAVLQNRRFKEYESLLRARPCNRKTPVSGPDQAWWLIDPRTDSTALLAELEEVVEEQVLPWLERTPNRESAIRQTAEQCVNYYTAARLLIECGHGEDVLPHLWDYVKKHPNHRDGLMPFILEIENRPENP